jgi:glyoxylase-like metal-dependent hydrolase (beta-lactamase superfamily II)
VFVHDRPVAAVERPSDDQTLARPAGRAWYVPGHTAGHGSVVLADRGVLITDDALVSYDYATGQRGATAPPLQRAPRACARLADRLAALDGDTLLFGHGDPRRDGHARALDVAGASDHNLEREPLTR